MRIIPFHIPKNSPEAFRIQEDSPPRLYDHLHQHPEIQITAILESEGTVLAGDYIGRFRQGDVFVTGSNLPHVFRNDKEFGSNGQHARTISVYFDEHMLGGVFWNLPETRLILEVLKNPQQAIQIKGAKAAMIISQLRQLNQSTGLDRLIHFLSILKHFENDIDLQSLSGDVRRKHRKSYDSDRINKVLEFTFSAFHRQIRLEEVAAIANLSVIAFCKYFRTRTGKTYFSFLSELRVHHAQKLLFDKSDGIAGIAYQSGFNNLSHFNRIFKKITGYTPTEYRMLQSPEILS